MVIFLIYALLPVKLLMKMEVLTAYLNLLFMDLANVFEKSLKNLMLRSPPYYQEPLGLGAGMELPYLMNVS